MGPIVGYLFLLRKRVTIVGDFMYVSLTNNIHLKLDSELL